MGTIGMMVEENKADLVEIVCNDYRRCLPCHKAYFIAAYKGTDVWNTAAKKYKLEEYTGNNLGETILRIEL